MTAGHDEVRERLGAFVLGQLAPDQADTVREHLVRCADCAAEAASLQPLAGPLGWVDADDPVPAEPTRLRTRVEQTLAEATRAAREADGRTRPVARPWLRSRTGGLVAAAVAGAVLAGGVATAVSLGGGASDPATPAVEVEQVPVVAVAPDLDVRAGLVDHTWGMEIELVGTGFVRGVAYDVVVTDERGRRHDSGAFVGVGSTEMTCALSAAVLREDAVRFAVRDDGGAVVARADLRA